MADEKDTPDKMTDRRATKDKLAMADKFALEYIEKWNLGKTEQFVR
jgi:hypothetical protein